ncbi:MAG: NUDIX domain-containing protein [Armatimonadetes bacterium]|nr:NUDIX domain-containing protein [Armatimonadota bacterium]
MAGAGGNGRNGRAGAGGVVLHGDRVLLLYKRLNGEWRLPKGRLNAGEDLLAAALREVSEETGFAQLAAVAPLGTRRVEYTVNGQRSGRDLTFFAMRLDGFTRCPRDRRDAKRFAVCWMTVSQALEALTFDDERQWLRQALDLA